MVQSKVGVMHLPELRRGLKSLRCVHILSDAEGIVGVTMSVLRIQRMGRHHNFFPICGIMRMNALRFRPDLEGLTDLCSGMNGVLRDGWAIGLSLFVPFDGWRTGYAKAICGEK